MCVCCGAYTSVRLRKSERISFGDFILQLTICYWCRCQHTLNMFVCCRCNIFQWKRAATRVLLLNSWYLGIAQGKFGNVETFVFVHCQVTKFGLFLDNRHNSHIGVGALPMRRGARRGFLRIALRSSSAERHFLFYQQNTFLVINLKSILSCLTAK